MASPVTSLQFRELATGRFRSPVTGRFIPNPIGIARLATGAALIAALHQAASVVAEAAKALASVEAFEHGDYMRSIRPASGVDKGQGGIPMAVARVNAWDFKANWIEYGTYKMSGRYILTRAAEASGFEVKAAGTNSRRIRGSGRERVIHLKG